MSLFVPEPPAKGLRIINEALGSLLSQPGSALSAMAGINPDRLSAAAPHRTYFVQLESVAEGRILSEAELTGWRYIVLNDESPLLAAELDIDADAGVLEFSNANLGPHAEGTLQGVRIAESLDEVRERDFELRLLEIPSLYVIALWLHGAEKDLLIPLPPTNPGLTPYRIYPVEDLSTFLREAAIKQLSFGEEEDV
jgi:hypothetical protein